MVERGELFHLALMDRFTTILNYDRGFYWMEGIRGKLVGINEHISVAIC